MNKRSGLLGLSTLSSDLRDIYQVAQNVSHPKCERCRLAFAVCVHRLRYVLGEMIAAMGGIGIKITLFFPFPSSYSFFISFFIFNYFSKIFIKSYCHFLNQIETSFLIYKITYHFHTIQIFLQKKKLINVNT